jgi:PAS domain S-box-containing protein
MPLNVPHPNSGKFVGLGRDIASIKQWAEALRRSEARFQAIFDNSPEALFIAQADGRLMDANNPAAQLTGHSREALKGMNLRDLFTTWKPPSTSRLQRQSPTQAPRFRETRLIKKDGKKIDIEFYHWQIEADLDDCIVLHVQDIREGKRLEKILRESEKKLRYLTYKIMNAQEEERRRISRELHDEVGQGLTVIKLFLISINKDLSPDLRHDCDAMLSFLDGFINNVRRLCRDLRPTLLEILGLSESLRHLLKESSEMVHFTGTAEIDEIDHLCDREVQINIYRIIQEALTNIGKYSQATKVFLRVREKPNLLQVRIEDNGIGFDVKEVVDRKAAPSDYMGLVSMKERARMSGGTLRVWSREGRGTKISVTIPITGKGGQLCLSVI